jgi:hypothetical protein
MAEPSEDLWKVRLDRQRWPLIGSNIPGDGNGYNDQLSFELPHHRLRDQEDQYRLYWLYTFYFQNLSAFLSPSFGNGKKFVGEGLTFQDCTENYLRTFYRYLDPNNDWRRLDLGRELSDWSERLVFNGRVIFEFVNWFDNDDGIFYGFELQYLDSDRCEVCDEFVVFTGPEELEDGTLKDRSVKIPRSKCIIIEWPKERGGYKGYLKTVQNVLNLGDIHGNWKNLKDEPGKLMENTTNWEFAFEKALSHWGTHSPNKLTSEFYKESVFFTYKGTLIYCLLSCINGFEQIFNLLNQQLGENGKVIFNHPLVDPEKLKDLEKQWLSGQLSFKEANEILVF